jgi:hypothetical protein
LSEIEQFLAITTPEFPLLLRLGYPLFTGNAVEHQLDGSLLATLVDLHHIDGHGLAVCVYPSDTLVEDWPFTLAMTLTA